MSEIKNGMMAKDVVTGFEGRVGAICDYWTGCTSVLLTPQVDADGKRRDSEWFDIKRLEVTIANVLALPGGSPVPSGGMYGGDKMPGRR